MLDARRARQLLHYDPKTGALTWRIALSNRVHVGGPAGWWSAAGYLYVTIEEISYIAQRIIWLYMTGEWPPDLVDHRDLDPSNNRWENLRPATHSQNEMNKGMRGGLRKNKAGIKGIYFDASRSRWSADILAGGIRHRLGRFDTKEAAATAYQEAAKRLHGEYVRL